MGSPPCFASRWCAAPALRVPSLDWTGSYHRARSPVGRAPVGWRRPGPIIEGWCCPSRAARYSPSMPAPFAPRSSGAGCGAHARSRRRAAASAKGPSSRPRSSANLRDPEEVVRAIREALEPLRSHTRSVTLVLPHGVSRVMILDRPRGPGSHRVRPLPPGRELALPTRRGRGRLPSPPGGPHARGGGPS